MRLAAIGSRTFKDEKLAEEFVLKYIRMKDDVLVSGGAEGADKICEHVAASRGYLTKIYKAEWKKYGKSAGFMRNKQIIEDCDFVLAFWDGVSKGTAHSLNIAKKLKKPTLIIYF